ncbi:adenylate cyclase type 10-like [Dendronephthya gigantea]|uniref:adenylate cyclase type 10-like n=1 Tax=Dendronephthya gigantea TaxID=151771 RepID=UPI00106B218A|nr:adenylate cyclase type 10-like [Dendronephthya gigantea]
MVPCGCYGNEGTKVVNLTKFLINNKLKKNCLYLKFSNNCVQETTYALWLKKQREGLHQKTAIHLESQAHKCRSCGGGAFLPYSKNTEQESSGGRSAMSTGRSAVHFSSDAAKRRSSRLIREKVQEQVAPVLMTSGEVDSRDSADRTGPDPLLLSFVENAAGTSSMRLETVATDSKTDIDLHDTKQALAGVNMARCECADILASVFPQLVMHWSAAGNKLKTFRYMTESGAAALATANNMQALSYLHDVQDMLQKEGQDFVANREEKARVESLIGQALLGMNRLDAAIVHLSAALKELGVRQPVTQPQILLRIYTELLRQAFGRRIRDDELQCGIDYEGILLEQARCFFHLSHVYHNEGRHRESFMAALQELNAAEKIGSNFHELLTAYSSVIECSGLLSWAKYAEKLEVIAVNRCKKESFFVSLDDLITFSNFYSVVCTFRFSRGRMHDAAAAGLESLSFANKINDHMLKINCIPSLSQCLILMSRIDECHDVLKELNYAAREKDDLHGRALYFCSCFDLILETGHVLETLDDCLQFTAQTSVDPRLTWDVIVKYYLNASLLLWHARCEDWEQAEKIFNLLKATQPAEFEVVIAARGFVKVAEYHLLWFRKNYEDKTLRGICKKVLKQLSLMCSRFLVLKPRYYHLKAYFSLLCGKHSKSRRRFLPRCIELSTQMGMTMEAEWAILSKHEWFDKKANSAVVSPYNGHAKFPLPKLLLNA